MANELSLLCPVTFLWIFRGTGQLFHVRDNVLVDAALLIRIELQRYQSDKAVCLIPTFEVDLLLFSGSVRMSAIDREMQVYSRTDADKFSDIATQLVDPFGPFGCH